MRTIEWNFEKKCIQAVDQTKIPYSYEIMDINTVDEAIDAIYALAVRGAPAIGTCGAMALALYCKNLPEQTAEAFYAGLDSEAARIVATRPTAVNLKWAVEKSVSEIKAAVISIIKGIDERINMHDFRVVTGPTHTNIIFDVLIPYKFQIQDDELAARITSQVRERLGNNYYVVIKVDHSYV